MIAQVDDPLLWIAGRVADCFSKYGYAFVEDDKVETLAATLRTFLTEAGIPVNASDELKVGTVDLEDG